MTTKSNHSVAAGSVVSVPVWLFRHVGIVSDRRGADGRPMVISNSRRRGGTFEECWAEFSGGVPVTVKEARSGAQGHATVRRARSMLGAAWRPVEFNCEHFVEEACGRTRRSPQLHGAVMISVLAVLLVLVGRQ